MFGAYAPGQPYFGQAPNIDPSTLPPPIILRAEDGSLYLRHERQTTRVLDERRTIRLIPERRTIQELPT